MREITKDIEIMIDGSRTGFRLFKLDAFSGVTLLRLLMRLENQNAAPTMNILRFSRCKPGESPLHGAGGGGAAAGCGSDGPD